MGMADGVTVGNVGSYDGEIVGSKDGASDGTHIGS